ncbi:GTPase [Tessaracoccus sp. Z1128]
MASVATQLDALREVLDLVAGRVPAEVEQRTRTVLGRATERLAAGEQTVVALAGATGSGKSSLFNALSGTRLAEQGPRRPTTSTTLAASFAATNIALLDFLGVARRHEVAPPEPRMADLVLLDLPDHDSTASSHRQEVDRMVGVVDQFVWVLDPQKYADAAIHRNYLQPLAKHRAVITVVLNQADRLTAPQLQECMAHIRRLLVDDGLADVPLLSTSAVTGAGIAELREHLSRVAAGKRSAAARLAADVRVAAGELDEAVGRGRVAAADKGTISRLTAHLSVAAGVPVVVEAVRGSVRHRGQLATGWPLVKWLGTLRPDPLKRLRLGAPPERNQLEGPSLTRSSLPARSAAAGAQQSSGLRAVAAELGEGMPTVWQEAIFRAVRSNEHTLADQLDRAVVGTDLKVARTPVWWQLMRVLQWLLIGAVVVGLGWLTVNVVLGYFGLGQLTTMPVGPADGPQVPLPTLLALGGVAAGILLSGGSQLAIGVSADRSARRARKALDASVAAVARALVLAPAEGEVQRYAAARAALDRLR